MTKISKKTLEDWNELAIKECKGKPVETLTWETPEGIPVKPLYTDADIQDLEHMG